MFSSVAKQRPSGCQSARQSRMAWLITRHWVTSWRALINSVCASSVYRMVEDTDVVCYSPEDRNRRQEDEVQATFGMFLELPAYCPSFPSLNQTNPLTNSIIQTKKKAKQAARPDTRRSPLS